MLAVGKAESVSAHERRRGSELEVSVTVSTHNYNEKSNKGWYLLVRLEK
jgi:hypothetical protein